MESEITTSQLIDKYSRRNKRREFKLKRITISMFQKTEVYRGSVRDIDARLITNWNKY